MRNYYVDATKSYQDMWNISRHMLMHCAYFDPNDTECIYDAILSKTTYQAGSTGDAGPWCIQLTDVFSTGEAMTLFAQAMIDLSVTWTQADNIKTAAQMTADGWTYNIY